MCPAAGMPAASPAPACQGTDLTQNFIDARSCRAQQSASLQARPKAADNMMCVNMGDWGMLSSHTEIIAWGVVSKACFPLSPLQFQTPRSSRHQRPQWAAESHLQRLPKVAEDGGLGDAVQPHMNHCIIVVCVILFVPIFLSAASDSMVFERHQN